MPNTTPWGDFEFAFGPYLPLDRDRFGLSYVTPPALVSDNSAVVIASERYFPHNEAKMRSLILVSATTTTASMPYLLISHIPAPAAGILPAAVESTYFTDEWIEQTVGGAADLTVSVLNQPISIQGVYTDESAGWGVGISPGLVWREHVVSSDEPSGSWIKRSGAAVGDSLILIYTVPEIAYGPSPSVGSSGTTNLNFPGYQADLEEVTEIAHFVDARTLQLLSTPVVGISNLSINGVRRGDLSTLYTGSEVSSVFQALDPNTGVLALTVSVAPQDIATVTYLTPRQTYKYHGFRDYSGLWYHLDLNPERGHYMSDEVSSGLVDSSAAASEGVLIYLVPSAYIVVSTFQSSSGTDSYAATAILDYRSAYSWGESHFIRHRKSASDIETVYTRGVKPAHWGSFYFGVDRYSAPTVDDYMILDFMPSAIPLGRILPSAGLSPDSASPVDVRVRGGGLPPQFAAASVVGSSGQVSRVKSWWDMANWDGPPVTIGGAAIVEIPSSVLSVYTAQDVDRIVQSRVPPGIRAIVRYV